MRSSRILVSSTQRAIRLPKRMLRRQVRWILEGAGVADYDVSVEVTGDRRMRALNRTLRGINKTTDVISTPLHEDVRPGEAPPALGGVKDLGDMFVSLPEVKRQAEAMGATWKERLPIVITHGVCHLLGYVHDTPESTEVMQRREDEILEYLWDREDEYWDRKK